jgi:hypothetical protein
VVKEQRTQLRMNKDSAVSIVICYWLETGFDLYQLHFIMRWDSSVSLVTDYKLDSQSSISTTYASL